MVMPSGGSFKRVFDGKSKDPSAVKDFFQSVNNGDAKKVTQMLQKNPAIINWQDSEGLTGLMIAAKTGNVAIAEALLNTGAPVDTGNRNNSTALMFAVVAAKTEMIALLLKKGADVNHANVNKSTALMTAAWNGDKATVQQLIAANADPALKDVADTTAAEHAQDQGHADIAQFLRTTAEKRLQQPAKPAAEAQASFDEESAKKIEALAKKLKNAGF